MLPVHAETNHVYALGSKRHLFIDEMGTDQVEHVEFKINQPKVRRVVVPASKDEDK